MQAQKSKPLQIDYPRSLDDNLDYRAAILKEAEIDPALQADLLAYCAKNIIYWVDNFCWTKDPRRQPDNLPFICYDAYQQETILDYERAIDEQYDLLTDKSRDMGASWMVLYVLIHKWLFEDGSDFRIGSRKEEYVDRPGDIDTLFEKLRFILQRLPKWMLPEGFDWDTNSTYMKLVNPKNGNSIVGESANSDFGSGGRRKAILLDEFSKWPNAIANAAWTSTADVTKCRLPISTPKGSGNKFAILAKGTKEKIKRLSLHWTLHPLKSRGAYYLDGDGKRIFIDGHPRRAFELWKLKGQKSANKFGLRGSILRSPWYDAECDRRKEEDIAQELDINYLQSGKPFLDLAAVSLQKKWEYLGERRKDPMGPIPWGTHIRVDLVEIDGKVELREKETGFLRLFELPDPDLQYVVIGDTSEGLPKGDECFMLVREKITRNVVAATNGLFKPEDFARKLWLTHLFFGKALTAPENNNMGYSVCSDLDDMGTNLYWTERESNEGGMKKKVRVKRGFSTTPVTRPLMLAQLEEEVRKNACEFRDPVLIDQMETFVHNEKTGKPEADGDFLDDGVLAAAIGSQVIQEHPYKPKASSAAGEHRKERQSELARSKNNGGYAFGRRAA